MNPSSYTLLYLTDDGKSVSFGIAGKEIPVEYFLETATGSFTSSVDGMNVLQIPKSYDIYTLTKEYEKSTAGIQEYVDYTLTSSKYYLGFNSVYIPVSYIAQEAPGTVVINDTIRIPSKYDMEYILKRFNESAHPEPSANPVEEIDKVLNEREKTHGDFRDHAFYTRQLKNVVRESLNSDRMSDVQMEALDMIAHKIGRILAGDPDFKDHWVDIEGYANLISRNL